MQTDDTIRPIWQAAIDRYYNELARGCMKRTPTIERDLWGIEGPNVLIEDIQAMVPQESQISQVPITVLPRLKPILLGLDDFAAVVAWSLGMDGRVVALLWGSMRLILKVSCNPVGLSKVKD